MNKIYLISKFIHRDLPIEILGYFTDYKKVDEFLSKNLAHERLTCGLISWPELDGTSYTDGIITITVREIINLEEIPEFGFDFNKIQLYKELINVKNKQNELTDNKNG